MIRPKPLLGTVALLLVAGSGLYWMTRRTPGAPPQEEAAAPFVSEPAGVGRLLVLQPQPAPLRSLRWTGPLPGAAAVAQILTQTGRQQALLTLEGRPSAQATFSAPPGVPEAFFAFADLVDAAVVPGQAALLLYRNGSSGEALLLPWDLATGQVGAGLRAHGDRLALSPDQRTAFLYGPRTGLALLPLPPKPGARLALAPLDLPPEVTEVSDLRPLGARAFLVAHPQGLALWREGTWQHAPLPAPSPLGFPRGLGRLAGGSAGGWWQPEPGLLLPLSAEGIPGAPRDLKALLPEAAALDAAMLRLLGTDPDGRLWFSLVRPTLPVPAPAAALEPSAPAAAEPGTPPPAPEGLGAELRAAWEAHLQKGLDRLYCWKPGEAAMRSVTWEAAWRDLAPPPGTPRPSGDGGLRPEAGGLLLGAPDRMWWLPLRALQPR